MLSAQLDFRRVAAKSHRAVNLSQTRARACKALPGSQASASSSIRLQMQHRLSMDMPMSARYVSPLAQRPQSSQTFLRKQEALVFQAANPVAPTAMQAMAVMLLMESMCPMSPQLLL